MNMLIKKWIDCLDTLYKELVYLSANQYIFKEVQEIIIKNSNIQKNSAFYDFYSINFATNALMTLRRLLMPNQGGISFCELLMDIKQNYKIITRDYFKNLYSKDLLEDIADRDFDKFAGKSPDDKDYISVDLINSDLANVDIQQKKIRDFIDKRIAHHDRCEPKCILTFKDLDDCIEFTEKILKKYFLILKAGNLTSSTPVFQYDWKEIFTYKWIE